MPTAKPSPDKVIREKALRQLDVAVEATTPHIMKGGMNPVGVLARNKHNQRLRWTWVLGQDLVEHYLHHQHEMAQLLKEEQEERKKAKCHLPPAAHYLPTGATKEQLKGLIATLPRQADERIPLLANVDTSQVEPQELVTLSARRVGKQVEITLCPANASEDGNQVEIPLPNLLDRNEEHIAQMLHSTAKHLLSLGERGGFFPFYRVTRKT